MKIELEQKADGRWIAEVAGIPGALAYGETRDDAVARVEALTLRILADRLEQGEDAPELESVFTFAAWARGKAAGLYPGRDYRN
jgi:predicted RNase H-like HicB family nuclease